MERYFPLQRASSRLRRIIIFLQGIDRLINAMFRFENCRSIEFCTGNFGRMDRAQSVSLRVGQFTCSRLLKLLSSK